MSRTGMAGRFTAARSSGAQLILPLSPLAGMAWSSLEVRSRQPHPAKLAGSRHDRSVRGRNPSSGTDTPTCGIWEMTSPQRRWHYPNVCTARLTIRTDSLRVMEDLFCPDDTFYEYREYVMSSLRSPSALSTSRHPCGGNHPAASPTTLIACRRIRTLPRSLASSGPRTKGGPQSRGLTIAAGHRARGPLWYPSSFAKSQSSLLVDPNTMNSRVERLMS